MVPFDPYLDFRFSVGWSRVSVMQPIFDYMEMQKRRFARERAERAELHQLHPFNPVSEVTGPCVVMGPNVPVISTDPLTGRKTQEG